MKEKVCGTCRYNRRTDEGHGFQEFCCGNEESEYYGVPTFYDETCDDWEEHDAR